MPAWEFQVALENYSIDVTAEVPDCLDIVVKKTDICVVLEEGVDEVGVLPMVVRLLVLLDFLCYFLAILDVWEGVVDCFEVLVSYAVPGFNYPNSFSDAQVERK